MCMSRTPNIHSHYYMILVSAFAILRVIRREHQGHHPLRPGRGDLLEGLPDASSPVFHPQVNGELLSRGSVIQAFLEPSSEPGRYGKQRGRETDGSVFL